MADAEPHLPDRKTLYSYLPPGTPEGATAQRVNGMLQIRNAEGSLIAIIDEAKFEAVRAWLTEAGRS